MTEAVTGVEDEDDLAEILHEIVVDGALIFFGALMLWRR